MQKLVYAGRHRPSCVADDVDAETEFDVDVEFDVEVDVEFDVESDVDVADAPSVLETG
jgi:hypothetical protein